MSQEQILKTLVGLGLTRLDSEVYIYLAKKGPQKGQEISKGLNTQKQQLYRSLKNLQSKGIVSITLEHPARFTAVSFDKVVDLFIKEKMAEAQRIQENRQEILANWQAIDVKENINTTPKFNVIEGRGYIYAKILQMTKETKNQLTTISPVKGLLRAEQLGLFDTGFERALKSNTRFRFLTEVTEQNVNSVKKFLNRMAHTKPNLEGRAPNLGLNLFPQMIIKDDEEAIFFIGLKACSPLEEDDIGLWTNCKPLIQAFIAVFEELWHNSTDIQEKITEIETIKTLPEIHIISDPESAFKKYVETILSAKKEIITIASSKDLVEAWKSKQLPNELTQKGISIKIMAPITSENIEAIQQLPEYCEVKHIPEGYLETTIIDGKHLFQFQNPSQCQERPKAKPYFENTFYTDDSEYVEKTKIMLDDVWKNAQAPSITTLELINRTSPHDNSFSDIPLHRTIKKMYRSIVSAEENIGLTEKDVTQKIINAKKCLGTNQPKDIVTTYGINAQAIVHPPSHLNLPDTLFHIYHMEKQSTYGATDTVAIHLWLDTPAGYAYMPVAILTDNSEIVDFWKRACANTPAEQNIQLSKKNELEINVHRNTLFAGWTTAIPLIQSYHMPPSGLLIEGYGDVKTNAYIITLPSGYKIRTEFNSYDAFVTFFHPSSKYSGPGTDGCLGVDTIMEIYPQ